MISKSIHILWLAAIAFIPIAFQSCLECSKKVPCPGFQDQSADQWLPYYDGTIIRFKSPGELPAVYTFDSLYGTKPYEVDSRFPRCEAQKILVTQERLSNGEPTLRIEMEKVDQMDGDVDLSFNFMLLGDKFCAKGLNSDGFSAFCSKSSENLPSVVLEGKKFNNVQCVTFDTSFVKKLSLYKVYFAKGQGLVGYETINPQRLWVKE
jgi:hypothetical protein